MVKEEDIYKLLEHVSDPEVPVLSVLDLGIVRDVAVVNNPESGQEEVNIIITPTYSGCPAMDAIAMNIRLELMGHGIRNVKIELKLHPTWSTDWMTENGKEKLKKYGIAPPKRRSVDELALFEKDDIPCPRCNSEDTELVSQYGATSCKSLYRCNTCKEPFEHFKCH